ncbi:MAG TPA: RidA family protein [Candidatus Binatia bacterium]|nr:RidA family protein [Candidatus Binatia bacterium]
MTIRDRLRQLDVELPDLAPTFEFLAINTVGDLVFVSGHAPFFGGEYRYRGKVGREIDLPTAQSAAECAALGCLASLEHALGTLESIRRVVKVNGYVNCTEDFVNLPLVTDKASTLLIALFGESGRHARTTVGVSSLPLGVAVEIELIVQLDARLDP